MHVWFRWMGGEGGLHAKSMTSQRYRATYKMAGMRYYGNVMTTTRWRLYVILHLQQYSRRLNFSSYFFFLITLFLILSFLEIRAERRQKSISVELSFAVVFAFRHHDKYGS